MKSCNYSKGGCRTFVRLYGVLILWLSLLQPLPSAIANDDTAPTSLWLGQKMMLDLRYFCAQPTASSCTQGVTALTPELERLLVEGKIGGVILFQQNVQTLQQTVALNFHLQKLMQEHQLPPLFIAIDQEGGRVSRLGDIGNVAFAGNMALGATYPKHGVQFAKEVAERIARQLQVLGINVNFAPSIDVNSNPDNPIINIRSYGQSPSLVGEMGQATVAGLQHNGVISAVKHFPGHGDTSVDSHTGLPRVERSKSEINAVELFPFSTILQGATPPAMVMTAHIQFPQLDATSAITRDGTRQVLPATLSPTIITSLLRNTLNYQGVVVTDALDMAGITQYFSPEAAVLQTFRAGADIALMPFTVRTPQDIDAFFNFQRRIISQLNANDIATMETSFQRILDLKRKYEVGKFTDQALTQRQKQAESAYANNDDEAFNRALNRAAITTVFGNEQVFKPHQRWQLIMPDNTRCKALIFALRQVLPSNKSQIQCASLLQATGSVMLDEKADIVVVGDISPLHGRHEMTILDKSMGQLKRAKPAQDEIKRILRHAKQSAIPTVFVAMRSPYVVTQYQDYLNAALATYNYEVEHVSEDGARGVIFDVLAKVLVGQHRAPGTLPVVLQEPKPKSKPEQ